MYNCSNMKKVSQLAPTHHAQGENFPKFNSAFTAFSSCSDSGTSLTLSCSLVTLSWRLGTQTSFSSSSLRHFNRFFKATLLLFTLDAHGRVMFLDDMEAWSFTSFSFTTLDDGVLTILRQSSGLSRIKC